MGNDTKLFIFLAMLVVSLTAIGITALITTHYDCRKDRYVREFGQQDNDLGENPKEDHTSLLRRIFGTR